MSASWVWVERGVPRVRRTQCYRMRIRVYLLSLPAVHARVCAGGHGQASRVWGAPSAQTPARVVCAGQA
eukprot:1507938-Rhodomonas_salina.4